MSTFRAAAILMLTLLLAACGEPDSRGTDPIADSAFTSSSLWDDGRAEVAFYQVRRSRNQYGEEEQQEFLVGSYLVKHDFDPTAEAKAASDARERVETFKYALFYELESGSYQYKRSYVTNARRSDLRPMKSSFASFDWCSNQYRELSFGGDGTVSYLMRSDDYGNERRDFDYAANSYPAAEIPLLVRAITLAAGDTTAFRVVLESGDVIGARAVLAGRDTLAAPSAAHAADTDTLAAPAAARATGTDTFAAPPAAMAADRIEVHYDAVVPSPLFEETDLAETYWISTDEGRPLLRIEASTGRYEMDLVEHLRSEYWEEDIFERLEGIETRP